MDNVLFEACVVALLLASIFLSWGAERFVDGASALSTNLGIEPLMVGVLVMGFGTSLPEFLVSVFASAVGNTGLSLGNAFGSNILNIGIVLGVAALLSPVVVKNNVVTAAKRGKHGLAFGNVIGSNLFNTLAVVGTAGFIAPAVLQPELVHRELPVMLGFTGVLIVMAYG